MDELKLTQESLNLFLFPGPNLCNDIFQIFLNMRSEKILKKPEIYRMKVLIFGLNCLPFIAQFAIKLAANKIEINDPRIAEILRNDSELLQQ